MGHAYFRHDNSRHFGRVKDARRDGAMRKSRVICIVKYGTVDHHREILEDAKEKGEEVST